MTIFTKTMLLRYWGALLVAVASGGWQVAEAVAQEEKAAEVAKTQAEGEIQGNAKPQAGKAAEKAEIDPMDWPNWRGPQQNSHSTEKNLVDEWNPKGGEGSNLIWKRSDLATRSTPIVMRGNLYVLVRHNPGTETEAEKVVCVDAATGEHKWEYPFNVYLTDVPDTRVGWSAVVGDPETGRVYAQGVNGYFCCLEGDTGKLVWDHSLVQEYGTISTYGGRTNFPVMFEDLVLISAILVGWGDTPEFDGLAKPAHRFLAFDKATGELRWLASTSISPPSTNYSTPTAKVIGGVAQLVIGGADGKLWGLQPRTGKPLWTFPLSRGTINASPLVDGTMVYAGHSDENLVGTTQGSIVAVDATQRGDLAGKEKWQTYRLTGGRSSPVMVEDRLWVVSDSGKLQILDPETGEMVGRKALGTIMRSTPVYADGKVYACTNTGIWYVLKPNGDSAETLHRLRLRGDQNDGSPIVSHGRIYLPTSEAMYCIGNKDVKPEAAPLPPPDQETPIEENPEPATILLSPYDSTLKPDASQKYTVRVYNKLGQLLRIAKPEEVKFRVEGSGEIAGDGTYTAPKRGGHTAALVFATLGELESKARVRIIPSLPWQFTFDKMEDLPITWIGGRVRYVIEDLEGEQVAKKLDVLPTPRDPNNKLGTRSMMFMGPSEMSNYTIAGDFRVTEQNGRMSDCGVINSGYTLVIRSGDQTLQLYSWNAHDHRTSAQAPLAVQPGVWYRLKLQVVQQKDTAEVKGKVWLRDQNEPNEWTVEMVDQSPVRSSSPGVFGHSQEAVFYMDNLSVTPNETPAEAK